MQPAREHGEERAGGPPIDRSFAAFYGQAFDRIAGSVRARSGADAEDIAQEALLVAHRRWDEVATLEVPDAWVRRVATRIAARRAWRERERTAREARMAHDGASDPSTDLDLAAAILDLPDRHAAAVHLHHLEDRPVRDVARRLGCTEGAAKVLLLRARRLLAERLTGLTGRWVSEQVWSPNRIARRLEGMGAATAIGPILDVELEGRGGRWELRVVDGSYLLERDDGLRLDHGASTVGRDTLALAPALNGGRARYASQVDGDRLALRLLDTTCPPTRDIPDATWLGVLTEGGPFVRVRTRTRL